MRIKDMTASLEEKYGLNNVKTENTSMTTILNESYCDDEEFEPRVEGEEILTEMTDWDYVERALKETPLKEDIEENEERPSKEELEYTLDVDLSDSPLFKKEEELMTEECKGKKCYNNKKGSVEYASNEKRLEREALYRKLANLDEDFEITEDNIDSHALRRTANTKNCPEERIRCELLRQPYTGYEEY